MLLPGLLAGVLCLAPTAEAIINFYAPKIRFFAVRPIEYRDLDGDQDRFPDTGETGRFTVMIQNTGPALTGIIATLTTADPDVDCLISWSVLVGDLATGQSAAIGSLGPSQPGFTFKASDSLQTISPTDPARIDLCLRFAANEYAAFSDPTCFSLTADLDLPDGASQTFVAGPDGVSPSPDDGTVLENFDLDRDGDGNFTINDTFRTADLGTGSTEHGFYLRGGDVSGAGTVAGVACFGYRTPDDGNPRCRLDPAFPMDWHLHCPPGATNCPNLETGTCVGGCSYASILPLAMSPPNSLHMGAHHTPSQFNPDPNGSTTHTGTLQGFVSSPINLAAVPRPGDLDLSMFHIARLNDDSGLGAGHNIGQCTDCADVQIQVDRDPDPAVDSWGLWEKLAPYQNIYDHKATAYSAMSTDYCVFTPADAGTAPPAPRGVHETMCYPQGAWSRCGSDRETTPTAVGQCFGPGHVSPLGTGVWVETKFSLAGYLGQRARFRWLAGTWAIFAAYGTYYKYYSDVRWDDGWWLDDISITGAIIRQLSPVVDGRPASGTQCPADLCRDADGDGYGGPAIPPCPAGVPTDCDDTNPDTYRNAQEVNDGKDNECPGDRGYGLIDELTGELYLYEGSSPYLAWPYQEGAHSYQVARSDRPTFNANCSVTIVAWDSFVDIPDDPPQGAAHFFLVRPKTPFLGSWGRDSSGQERTGICGL